MITNDQIEAAAQAIRTVVAKRSNKGRSWESIPDRLKADYRAEALAALRAAGL